MDVFFRLNFDKQSLLQLIILGWGILLIHYLWGYKKQYVHPLIVSAMTNYQSYFLEIICAMLILFYGHYTMKTYVFVRLNNMSQDHNILFVQSLCIHMYIHICVCVCVCVFICVCLRLFFVFFLCHFSFVFVCVFFCSIALSLRK